MSSSRSDHRRARLSVEGLEDRNLTTAFSGQAVAVTPVVLSTTGVSGHVALLNPNPDDPTEPVGPAAPNVRVAIIAI